MNIKSKFDAAMTLRALEKSPESTVKRMRMALLESCRLVQRGARQVHRFKPRSGALEQAIQFRVNLNKCDGVVDINLNRAPYGNYVHAGTKPHLIKAKNKKVLRFVGSHGRFVSKKEVFHPGTKKDEFLYKSANRNRVEINDIFARHTQSAIKEAGL